MTQQTRWPPDHLHRRANSPSTVTRTETHASKIPDTPAHRAALTVQVWSQMTNPQRHVRRKGAIHRSSNLRFSSGCGPHQTLIRSADIGSTARKPTSTCCCFRGDQDPLRVQLVPCGPPTPEHVAADSDPVGVAKDFLRHGLCSTICRHMRPLSFF
jgi:hypothetical protein